MATTHQSQGSLTEAVAEPTSKRELVRVAQVAGLTVERRDRVREQALSAIPSWYSPWGHLGATLSIGLAVLVVSILEIHRPRALEWLVLPAVFVFANWFEWRIHKYVLHRRTWPMQILYDRHTPLHHMVYVEEDMEVRTWRELRLVLIPAAGVLTVVVVTAPFAAAIAWLWSANAGWLFLVSASLYMVTYEVFHLAYHLPKNSFIGRMSLVRVLRAHHARHHDPRLMQRYNFNVTVPLFDWLLGTIAKKQ